MGQQNGPVHFILSLRPKMLNWVWHYLLVNRYFNVTSKRNSEPRLFSVLVHDIWMISNLTIVTLEGTQNFHCKLLQIPFHFERKLLIYKKSRFYTHTRKYTQTHTNVG